VSCRALQFAFVVNVLQVQADVLLGRMEQVGHVLLRQPDGFAFQSDFDLSLTILRGIEEELSFGRRIGIWWSNHASTSLSLWLGGNVRLGTWSSDWKMKTAATFAQD
jgi:hypothetical protein